jgi:hypothetical protein
MPDKPKSNEPVPAPPKAPAKTKRPRPTAAFIASVVQNPAAPPKCFVVGGYLGESDQPDCWRLYLSHDLSSYLDIGDEGILHHEPVQGAQLGELYLWVAQDARVKHSGHEVDKGDKVGNG